MEQPIEQAAVNPAVAEQSVMPKSTQLSWHAIVSPDLAVHPKLKDRALEDILRDYLNPKAVCDATDPQDYQLAKPRQDQGYDDDLAVLMRQIMFDAGLTKAQAAKVHDSFVELSMQAVAEEQALSAEEEAALADEIKQTWGKQAERKLQDAQRGASFIGLDADELAELADQVHAMRLLDALARMGAALDEDSLSGLGGQGGMTATQAAHELQRLAADKEHLQAFLNPANPRHAEAKALRAQLAMAQSGVSPSANQF